jgi:hypothetical protein
MTDIPKSFTVGGQDIEVVTQNTINGDKLGEACLWNGIIKISEIYKGHLQCESSKFNTFHHELIHLILDTMGEYELSANERFINTFSGFLTEAIRSFKYE